MAVVTPEIKGFPVLEVNVMKARHAGRIWSQYELDETSFSTGYAYNGMILAIDDANKSVKLPVATTSAAEVYALHFSAEAEYEHKGLNTFAVAREASETNPNVSVHYPRMFELSVGDTFHTNCVKLDGTHVTTISGTTATTAESLIKAGTPVYGGVNTSGYIMVDTTKPTVGPVLQAVAQDTLPNGEWALKFVVRKA